MLSSVQGSWCLATGPGTCNLNIEGTPVINEKTYRYSEVWTGINIFDHACNLIGYLEKPVKNVAIYSELPWTVVITEIQNNDRNFAFCYAGTCYDNGFTYNSFDEDGSGTIECLRAFDCDNELRTAKQERSSGYHTWNESALG
ncbi:hypothetical protein UA08_06909 [Talaromyces atroroseus]|uniref:Uncharacterized protein n=1 Tax=Talaromyces atroroseus TaxID=1441469 RepID=A0A225API7_TALAT|nr:hypothetical protein UA08_06909 [Talaromyces atroroseus]OKL57519.1 hypothetical protein UA08_06909 [Talaromyces atroroseus]